MDSVGHSLILGASRGLGRALALRIAADGAGVTGFARKEHLLAKLKRECPGFEFQVADFSKPEGQQKVLDFITAGQLSRVFIMAGGGPYGLFHERSFKDHRWSFETSFIFPACVLHALAQSNHPPQTIIIGSSVAENAPDPRAASYCAAKHALRGLFLSVRQEYPHWDLRLFSPGYMDTDLVPKNAAVRNERELYNPTQIADELWRWTLTPPAQAHKMYPNFPRGAST